MSKLFLVGDKLKCNVSTPYGVRFEEVVVIKSVTIKHGIRIRFEGYEDMPYRKSFLEVNFTSVPNKPFVKEDWL